MTPAQITDLAMSLPETTQEEPFSPGLYAFKVVGKVFAIMRPEEGRITLKCDPALALELRAQFPAVTPGYHTNKRHWNTVELDGSVPSDEIHDMVEHSYDQVVRTMPKYVRERIGLIRPEIA